MKPVVEIASSFIDQMLLYLSSLGIDTKKFLQESGVNISVTGSPDTRVAIQDFYRIQQNALTITKDSLFGLHLGEFAAPGSFSILGYIMMNCRTLEEALEKICQYQEVIGNFIQIRISKNKEEATLSFDIRLANLSNIRHCYEASVSSFVNLIRSVTGNRPQLKKITFSHEAGSDNGEYNRVFGCPISFNQEQTSIVFDKKVVKTPIAMNNPQLLELFEKHARSVIDLNTSDKYYTGKVSGLILDWLSDGTPPIERAAKELSMSVRSLQTKLSGEGVTYRQLLENIRKDLASGYLRENRFSIDDIAWLLGFSEPSIFRKSFKKWTGETPGSYRHRYAQIRPDSKR